METKLCRGCSQPKPLSEFNPIIAQGKRPRSRCKECAKAERRARYVDQGGIDKSYAQVLQREYGITLDDYNALLRKQAHRCAICRRGETGRTHGKIRRLAVDHDHITGAVRGLLCQRCNLLVWALEDNHTTLTAVGGYIETFRDTFAGGAPT